VDKWGTPFQFHLQTTDKVGIISAGPDKELWTQDDLIPEELEEAFFHMLSLNSKY